MKFKSRRVMLGTVGTIAVGLISVALARAQAGQEPRPQMAEQVFKNVQMLKGIPVDEFMDTMGMFAAALALKITVQPVEIRSPAEISSAIASIPGTGSQAALLVGSTMFNAYRKDMLAAMSKLRLPAIYTNSSFVEEGGLIAYSPDIAQLFHRVAGYVDKILKGAKPGDLPIEQPTKLELVVNLKTARALGITIPQSVLLRADRVID